MATLTKGKTFVNGELVTPASLHALVDSATVANIVNADIAAGAAIADTKLAQITTAGKVLPAAVQGTAVITTDSRLSDARTPISHTHSADAITSGTLSNARTTANTANTGNAIVARDASGNFSAGTITASSCNIGTVNAINQLRVYPDGTGTKFFDARPGNITVFKDATVSDSAILTLGCSFESSSGTQFVNFNRNYSFIGSISQSGTSSISYNTSSDYRLKTNIEPLTAAVARLLQIPARRFNWLADPNGQKVDGFLAHEAQAVVPESVTGTKDAVDADGKPIYQGIDQSKLVPLLVAAVQELAARVAALEAK